jgi:hypothetical protein
VLSAVRFEGVGKCCIGLFVGQKLSYLFGFKEVSNGTARSFLQNGSVETVNSNRPRPSAGKGNIALFEAVRINYSRLRNRI